jgi:hypothetical protein
MKPHERAVELDYPKNLGLRTKLGGEPEWIQSDDTPACPHCNQPMKFVAQIDSIEHQADNNPWSLPALGDQDYMFEDVGMIYVFFCFDCGQPTAILQGY